MQYDLIIIGAGLVGASLACALEGTHKKIKILEAKPYQDISLTHSRPISLTYKSHLIFKRFGLWEALEKTATPIEQVHISSRGQFGITRLSAADTSYSALGYVIELAILHQAIQEKLYTHLEFNSQVTQLETLPDGIRLTTSQGILEAPLVIAADGQHSFIRTALGIDFKEQETIHAITAQLPLSHHNVAYERFTEDGVIALLPLTENRMGLVWTSDQADHWNSYSDQDFLSSLQKKFGYRAGQFRQIINRQKISLKTGFATESFRPHVILLGNASQTLSPIAAQGFNLSLQDTAWLYDAILEKISWETYHRLRKQRQTALTRYTRGLSWLFEQQAPYVTLPRSIAMTALSACQPIKRCFIEFATGMNR